MDRPPDARPRTWRAAMASALYGDDGFYGSPGAPARAFRTAAHTSPLWAATVLELARRIDSFLGEPTGFAIVDVGAGGGELLRALAQLAPDRWTLIGVDLASRPATLPARVAWRDAVPSGVTGLVIATELLDVVPIDVVELTDAGPRLIEVEANGNEGHGDVVRGRDAEWLSTWWPLTEVGDRAEIGWPRDDVWHSLTESLQRGAAVAIDYAAEPDRDVAGTLTGFRDGRQVAPVPDGRGDLTAHVRFESMLTPDDLLTTQRDALQQLGLTADRPAYDGDAAGYLKALSTAGEAAELLDLGGLGGFTWLVHAVGIPHPMAVPDRVVGS